MSYRNELIQVAAVALAMAQVNDFGSTELDSQIGQEKLRELLVEVILERKQQEKKWGPRNHPRSWWYAILGEEFGEVGRAILEE